MRRIARFARFWGLDAYRSSAMRWPTRDGVIPFRVFFALESERLGVTAEEELSHYHATLLATAQIHGGPQGKPERDKAVRALTVLALPEVPHE